MSLDAVASALTRACLLLYPPGFRREMGAALTTDVRRRASDISVHRLRALLWLPRLVASLLANAAGAWIEAAPGVTRPGVSWLDLRLALRMLVKYPGLTLTGGFGIAVAMAIVVGFFSMNHWYFNPAVPLPDGDRLVGLVNWDRQTHREQRHSAYDFLLWRSELRSVEDLMAFRSVPRNLIADDGSVEYVMAAEMTPSGFSLARVPPFMGRTIIEADSVPGAPPVVVIGYDVWRTRFGSAHDIVGRTVRLGGAVHTVVGVMPDGFAFPVNHKFWLPLAIDHTVQPGTGAEVYVSGRLAKGMTVDSAQAELTVLGERLKITLPSTHADLRPEVLPYTYQFAGMSRASGSELGVMNFAVSLILIVVCANVAILVYARTAARMGEFAVRGALGASRARIVAQMFAESLVLTTAAGAVGLFVIQILLMEARRLHRAPEFWRDYSLPPSAVLYAAALMVLAAVITGVIPALQSTGRKLQINLMHFNHGAAPRLGRVWSGLIVVQVAVAVAIVPIVMALGWSQMRELVKTPAFAAEQYLAAGMAGPQDRLARARAELARRLRAESTFASHTFVGELPGLPRETRVSIQQGHSVPLEAAVQTAAVDGSFFRTIAVRTVAGRSLASSDEGEHAADVVLVDRAFAERITGPDALLGRYVRFLPDARPYEIVGVVDNIETTPLDRTLARPTVYRAFKAGESSGVKIVIRLNAVDQATAATTLRRIVASVDPWLTVETVPLDDIYRARRFLFNAAAVAIAVAVSCILLLSGAGVYALVSFTVAQRSREIAIRLALGARASQLLGHVFARAMRQVAMGIGIGIGLALLLDASADGEALVGHAGPLLVTVVGVIAIVGLIAAMGPARRGLRIDPSAALRGE